MPLLQALFWRFLFLEGVNAIKAEEKRRHSVWLDDATWSKVQHHYKLDGCTTQNDFIDKAIQFYCGYLQSEYAGDFLPKILGETLEAILSMFGDRIGKLLLKQAVEQNVCNHELEKLPEVAAYYSVWNGVRDTLEGYYKNRPRQHNPLSQQKEFRAIKNAIIQEAERLRQQMEQESLQDEEPSAENTSTDASANPTLADENTSSTASHDAQLPSEYLLNSTIRLFHQMGQIFRENAAPPSNPMGIRVDSKRRKKLMQKRLAMGHKRDDHEQEQGYNLDIR